MLSDAISVPPSLSNNRYILFVIVWLAVRAADVTVTSSSKVKVTEKSDASAYSPAVKSILKIFAFPKTLDKLLIQTIISGSAAVLSLPEAAKPDFRAHPPGCAIQCSLAPELPAALESSGNHFGLPSAVVYFPHIAIVIS